MLIYNSKKEFIGAYEEDLNALGFSNLTELRAESADFADMFVKTPGFIHNFKHVHWIDFVTASDSMENSKVIIHANSRNFKCSLDIRIAYLTDDPSSKAYLIHLFNLRELTNKENEEISGDLLEKPMPKAAIDEFESFEVAETEAVEPAATFTAPVIADPYEDTALTNTIDEFDTKEDFADDTFDTPIDLDFDEEQFEEKTEKKVTQVVQEFKPEDTPIIKETVEVTQEEYFDNGYVYDPNIASDELGLPVDLIEEFIEDFIAQAKEFKDDLYKSLDDDNSDNIKILSHKLKGVAANLRIEDAFEALTIINTSEDTSEISENVDIFYNIVSKLSGEKISVTKTQDIVVEEKIVADTIDIDFEENNYDDTSSEVVEEIEELDIFAQNETMDEVKEVLQEPKLDIDDELNLAFEEPKLDIEEKLDLTFEEPEIDLEEKLDLAFEEPTFEEPTLEINDNQKPDYNKKLIAKEIGIPYDSFLELFDDYLEEAQDIVKVIVTAVENNDSILWKSLTSRLKGMSDNMRINEFSNELETLIKTQDMNIAKDSINEISSLLTQISEIKG